MKSALTLLLFLSACAGKTHVSETLAETPAETREVTANPTESQTPAAPRSAVFREAPVKSKPRRDPGIQFSVSDLSDWNLVSEEDGVKTYVEKHPKNGIIAFRGETFMHASLKKLATVLNSLELRKEWVASLAETRVIEGDQTLERIEYNRTKVPWPFQDRDFVFHAQVTVDRVSPAILISMNSITDPREPPRSGVVRGEVFSSYYFLKEVVTNGVPTTEVVVEIAADPKGVIPAWLVNATQKKWPKHTLRALEKCANRTDLKVSPEIEGYFSKKE